MWIVPPQNLFFFLSLDKENFNFLLAEKACDFLFSGVCILFFLSEERVVAFATSRLSHNQTTHGKNIVQDWSCNSDFLEFKCSGSKHIYFEASLHMILN